MEREGFASALYPVYVGASDLREMITIQPQHVNCVNEDFFLMADISNIWYTSKIRPIFPLTVWHMRD